MNDVSNLPVLFRVVRTEPALKAISFPTYITTRIYQE